MTKAMTRIFYILLFFLLLGFGCMKVEDNWRPTGFDLKVQELSSGASKTYRSSQASEIQLQANKKYDFGLKLLDTSSGGDRDISEQIQNENTRWLIHYIYIASSGARDALRQTTGDLDTNGQALGLLTSWTTKAEAGSGKLRIQCKRDANKGNASGGELFIDVLLNVSIQAEAGGSAAPTKMRYRVRFVSTWSNKTHPVNFPTSPHFSPLVGGTHKSTFSLWAPDRRATNGLKQVAETGNRALISEEIKNAIASGAAQSILEGSGLSTSPSSTHFEFECHQSHPFVSIVSMLAPSPDWFIGVRDVRLFENDKWITEKKFELRVYDAGTDSGTQFMSDNAPTSPAEDVARLTSANGDTDFRNGEPIVGSMTFTALPN